MGKKTSVYLTTADLARLEASGRSLPEVVRAGLDVVAAGGDTLTGAGYVAGEHTAPGTAAERSPHGPVAKRGADRKPANSRSAGAASSRGAQTPGCRHPINLRMGSFCGACHQDVR
jgi:hypothetical protein